MSTEDRVRDATKARADLVRDIRPLDLPVKRPARAPARARRDHSARRDDGARRWLSWGAPLAAAAVITALAVTLALVRQAGHPHSAPAAPPAPASVPRYYAALAPDGSDSSPMKLVVGDDQTGRTFAVVNPSASMSFYGVTGAADDRTFVAANFANQETTWYLLRLDPGAAHPVRLTKLPIAPVKGKCAGLALSPDGRELAVMRAAGTAANGGSVGTRLAVYSVSSGAVLHSWSTNSADAGDFSGANVNRLSWVNGDQSLDFRRSPIVPGVVAGTLTVRTIGLTAAGTDLLAASRLVLTLPLVIARTEGDHLTYASPCGSSSLGAQDGTIVCGSNDSGSDAGIDACAFVPPSFATYSGTTGRQLKTLYQYRGRCVGGSADVLWTDSGGRHVIVLLTIEVSKPAGPPITEYGLVSDGRFTPLPQLFAGGVTLENDLDFPGRFAF